MQNLSNANQFNFDISRRDVRKLNAVPALDHQFNENLTTLPRVQRTFS